MTSYNFLQALTSHYCPLKALTSHYRSSLWHHIIAPPGSDITLLPLQALTSYYCPFRLWHHIIAPSGSDITLLPLQALTSHYCPFRLWHHINYRMGSNFGVGVLKNVDFSWGLGGGSHVSLSYCHSVYLYHISPLCSIFPLSFVSLFLAHLYASCVYSVIVCRQVKVMIYAMNLYVCEYTYT